MIIGCYDPSYFLFIPKEKKNKAVRSGDLIIYWSCDRFPILKIGKQNLICNNTIFNIPSIFVITKLE